MSSRNKHRRNDRLDNSNNDDNDDGEYDSEGKNTRGRDQMENDFLQARWHELENVVKSLRTEIRLKRSHDRQMKRQMRINYEWDGEEANLSDKVSEWVKAYLFPR